MKKHLLEPALALGLALSLVMGSLACNTQNNISKKLIRLHIIANSDSLEDQSLKIKVRDEVIKHVSTITENCRSIDEAREAISKNLNTLESAAFNVIEQNGYHYSAKAELEKAYFPTRTYDSFSLPAGEYEALRIKLGAANGKNWWCVLFPPVCVSAAEVKDEFKNAGMTEKEINFIMSDEIKYKFKFRIVELLKSFSD